MEKRCSKCRAIKDSSLFYRSKTTRSGLSCQCKECKKKVVQLWKKANPEKVRIKYRRRHHRLREKDIERAREISRKKSARLRATPKGKLGNSMSSGIYASITKGSKGRRHWEDLVGYTVDQLKTHIERQFDPDMKWENYGEWHIDHIIPISAFNYCEPGDMDFKRCWALKNLRPMWATENERKGTLLVKPFQPSLSISG